MKRASTIPLAASLLFFFTGIANAQSAPPPLPAPSVQPSAAAPDAAVPPVASPSAPASSEAGAPSAAPPALPADAPATPPAEPKPTYLPPAQDPEAEERAPVAAPHAGFAMTLSLGYSAAAGATTGAPNDDLSNAFGSQAALGLEIGANVTPSFFVGLYGQYGMGGVNGTTDASCTKNNLDCSAHTLRGGLALRYRFLPGGSVRPWLGYAIGYEVASLSAGTKDGMANASIDFSGLELGHFSAGVDFMTGEDRVAVGPYFDVGVGEYTHAHEEGTRLATRDADIQNTALHQWITLGVRVTFMP